MLQTAFSVLGSDVSWLELAAFLSALACVVLNVLEIHWGWPLSIGSSLLYGWLFAANRLYGEAALQVLFVLLSAWGWWQWLYGRAASARADGNSGPALRIRRMGARFGWALVAWVVLWPACAVLLAQATDSDVPWLDAGATAGSVVGQVLLGRKLIENWLVWIAVNLGSVGLFAYKGLALTALLYAIFAVLAVAGWWRWRRLAG